MRKEKTLTLKQVSELANCPPYTVRYLYSCRRLTVVNESRGQGYPVLFDPRAVEEVKAHINKNQPG